MLAAGHLPKILSATVFHGHLLVACEGGRVFVWRGDRFSPMQFAIEEDRLVPRMEPVIGLVVTE